MGELEAVFFFQIILGHPGITRKVIALPEKIKPLEIIDYF